MITQSEKDGKYGVKNINGQLLVPQKYVSIVQLPENNFLVYEENPGWPMIINLKNDILVSKTNYIGKAIDAWRQHFICQYYKDGKLAELVLIKAPDIVLYTFPSQFLTAEFVKDSCYTYVSAQSATPGEKLLVDLKGKKLTGPENIDFDNIKKIFNPCNGYAIVIKDKGVKGMLYGVYDLGNKKTILPCDFYDIEVDVKAGFIKAYKPVYTLTYDLYNFQGVLVKTWDQIKK